MLGKYLFRPTAWGLGLCLGLMLLGCAGGKKAVVVAPSPTCEEVVARGIGGYSDRELKSILDDAAENERWEACWLPVMEACLDERREIPQAHLSRAVHMFNKRRFEARFHQAVYRHLSNAARGEARYGEEDRVLLKSYCSFVIQEAETKRDERLAQAELLCRRLDPELYTRLFQ